MLQFQTYIIKMAAFFFTWLPYPVPGRSWERIGSGCCTFCTHSYRSFIKWKNTGTVKKLRDLNARREHDAGDDHGDEEQEPVHHTRGRGVLQHQIHNPVIPVLRIWDPVPFWPPGSAMGKHKQSGSGDPGWTTRIIFPTAYKQIFGLKYFNSLMRMWDGKKFGSGINIPDPRNTAVILRRKQKADTFFGFKPGSESTAGNNMGSLFACGHNFLIPGCSISSIWVEPEENWKVQRTTKNLSADKKRRKMNIWTTYTTEISSDFFPQMNVSGSGSASRVETTQHDKKSKTIKVRKRIILGSWIRIRIRVKSWIRICIKVKVLQLQRLKNGTTESHRRSKLRCGVYVGQQLRIHITLMRGRIRIRFKVKIGFGSAWKWKKIQIRIRKKWCGKTTLKTIPILFFVDRTILRFKMRNQTFCGTNIWESVLVPGTNIIILARICTRNPRYQYAKWWYCVGNKFKVRYHTLQLGQRAQPAVQAVDVKQQARLVRLRIPPILALVLV